MFSSRGRAEFFLADDFQEPGGWGDTSLQAGSELEAEPLFFGELVAEKEGGVLELAERDEGEGVGEGSLGGRGFFYGERGELFFPAFPRKLEAKA